MPPRGPFHEGPDHADRTVEAVQPIGLAGHPDTSRHERVAADHHAESAFID
jgi:hypothetical protein